MSMHELKIKTIGIGRADLFLDGQSIKGITSFTVEGAVGKVSHLTLTMMVKSVEVDGPVHVTTIGDESRTVFE